MKIQLSFLEKVLCLHGNFTLQKTNIASVSSSKPKKSWREFRAPGTFFPGLIKAGTYYTKRGKEFWYVTKSSKFPLTITLSNNSYKRLIFGFQTESMRDSAKSMIEN